MEFLVGVFSTHQFLESDVPFNVGVDLNVVCLPYGEKRKGLFLPSSPVVHLGWNCSQIPSLSIANEQALLLFSCPLAQGNHYGSTDSSVRRTILPIIFLCMCYSLMLPRSVITVFSFSNRLCHCFHICGMQSEFNVNHNGKLYLVQSFTTFI